MKHFTYTALLLFCGCGLGFGERPRDVSDRYLAGKYARITIPESATNFHCRTEKGIDRATYGRFDISAAELKQIIDGMPKDGKHEAYAGYSHVTSHVMNESWWQPEQLQNRKVIEWSLPSFSVNLLYGDSGTSESITIYFFNFEL